MMQPYIFEHNDEKYTRAIIRTLWISVTDCVLHTGFSSHGENKIQFGQRLSGKATLEKDSISLIGAANRTKDLQVSIRPYSLQWAESYKSETQIEVPEWTSIIGYSAADKEFEIAETWYLQLLVSQDCFANLLKAYEEAKLSKITLGIRSRLWAHDFDFHAHISDRITWYLKKSSTSESYDSAFGAIEHIGWSDHAKVTTSDDIIAESTATTAIQLLNQNLNGIGSVLTKIEFQLKWGLSALAVSIGAISFWMLLLGK